MRTPPPNTTSGAGRPKWGYALPWYHQLAAIPKDADPLPYQIDFAVRHGLEIVSTGLNDLMGRGEASLKQIAERLAANRLKIAPHFGFDLFRASERDAEEEASRAGAFLERHHALFADTIVKTSAPAGNRFDRSASWHEKRNRMSRALRPLAKRCWELGLPLAIENHGDFYCSDLAELCEKTENLYIFLDTGNTYLIGERPDLAFPAAVSWTVGTHFKDHRVRPRPDSRPLCFEVEGSALGEGDVPLRECYALLLEKAPWPQRLVMEIEMIAPTGMNPLECFERSLAFVRSLHPST